MASMVLAIVSPWVLRFPLAYLLSERFGWGPDGTWWAFPIANVVAGLIALAWFAQGGGRREFAQAASEQCVGDQDQVAEDLRSKESLH